MPTGLFAIVGALAGPDARLTAARMRLEMAWRAAHRGDQAIARGHCRAALKQLGTAETETMADVEREILALALGVQRGRL